jgi:RNA polymerase sigma-B factor
MTTTTTTTSAAGCVRRTRQSTDAVDLWPVADRLLARLAELSPDDPKRARLRHHVICQCLPLAHREASRYRNTGELFEDLVQVATVGLILAVDRFDPGRAIPFKHFAIPTIAGELKRHFRDKGWGVKVSRRMQELYHEVRTAEPQLAQCLGRMPKTEDLASYLSISEEDVLAARGGEAAYTTRSLNGPVFGEDDPGELGERIGGPDRAIEAVAERDALTRALPLLPDRQRLILSLRFVDELSQSQIADKVGISQMHVSRLINRSLGMLRRHMTTDVPSAA